MLSTEIMPEYLQIEVIAGACSADCIMCNYKESPRKGILSLDDFSTILDKFMPYLDSQKYLSLQGLGETLLDPSIVDKVRVAKAKGFKGVGFATNATHLNADLTEGLLAAGLDTIIFSLDGIKKDTHEQIRKVDYNQVIRNVLDFIEKRNNTSKSKIIVRMIRQESNRAEWDEYREFWLKQLRPEFGDQVAAYDVWGQMVEEERVNRFNRLDKWSREKKEVCPDLLKRMLLFLNGDVILCCGNMKVMGNVFDNDPKDIYNGKGFQEYREMMSQGRLTEIDKCKNCQVILSSFDKVYVDATGS